MIDKVCRTCDWYDADCECTIDSLDKICCPLSDEYKEFVADMKQ